MKKILSILLVVCLVMGLMTACGGDDKKAGKKEETITIVGTWEYESMGAAYVFNADGTGAYQFAGSEMKFTYTDDGSTDDKVGYFVFLCNGHCSGNQKVGSEDNAH